MTATLSPPLETPAAAATCRFCGAGLTRTFVDLGMSPRCDGYLRAWQLTQTEPVFPLHVWVCDECFLVQLPQHANGRSEEHTSELQSQSNLVCRLLLEKKKKTI